DAALTTPSERTSRTSRARLEKLAAQYAKALGGGKASAVPFAPDCVVRENGKPPATSCADAIDTGIASAVTVAREHRNLLVDEEQGLVLALLATDHAGDVLTVRSAKADSVNVPDAFRVPSTYYQPTLFKVRDGRITRVETLVRPVFYGLSTGWPAASQR